MPIDPVGILGTTNNSQLSSGNDVIDKNEFMMLLVTQLQNQDPLNPMEYSEFTSQMAQFASLEQLQNANDNIESLHSYQEALFNENVVSFIGKDIKALNNEINMEDGQTSQINFDLERDANLITVSLYDSENYLVRTLNMTGQFGAEEQNIAWDGKDDLGTQAPDGNYYYVVQAVDTDGITFNGTPFYEGQVTSVNFTNNGVAYLSTGERDIAVGNVMMVKENKQE